MKHNLKTHVEKAREGGFTLSELLITGVIAAVFLTTAATVYQSATAHQRQATSYGDVEILESNLSNFYGLTGTGTRKIYFAPNYGRLARVDFFRSRFLEDVESSVAVYCFGRTTRNPFRLKSLVLSQEIEGTSLDSPTSFLNYLSTIYVGIDNLFTAERGVSSAPNATIFMMDPSDDYGYLRIRAIYEFDAVTTTSPSGVYVSIRRHVGTALTDYYDVFYDGIDRSDLGPFFASFEKADRSAIAEPTPPGGQDPDIFKAAKNLPFYFVWFPDPSNGSPDADATHTLGVGDPRYYYEHMASVTSFMHVVPMFPPF